MRLFVLFLGVLSAGLLLVGGLNWWVDPLGEFYEPGVVAEAERTGCLVSLDLLGAPTWPAFKGDLLRRRDARTVVLGTSRVLKLSARPQESDFVNAGMPGTGPETLVPLLRWIRQQTTGRITVLLGVEIFWFNRTWLAGIELDRRASDTASALLSRTTARESVELLAEDPSALTSRVRRDETPNGCVLERSRRIAPGARNAWELDGSFQYGYELEPGASFQIEDDFTRDAVTFQGIYYKDWQRLDPERIADLEAALALAREWGWDVIGFVPPYAPRWVERLSTAPRSAARWREVGELLPVLFRRHGFRFVDLRDVRDVPCSPDAFVDSGWHVNDACASSVRAALDRRVAP